MCTVFWNRFEPVPIFYPPATVSQALERDGQGPRPQFWFSFVTGLLPSFLAINDVYSAQKIKSSFFFLLNKDFIAQKLNPKQGRHKKIGLGPISNKSLRHMRRQIGDGDRPRPIYKSCPLGKQMCRYITHFMNKRKFNIKKPMNKEQDII